MTGSMITPEMIEAHKRALLEAWPAFRAWFENYPHPKVADLKAADCRDFGNEPIQAALTAALALHKPAMAGEIEEALEWLDEEGKDLPGEGPDLAFWHEQIRSVAAALRSLVMEVETLQRLMETQAEEVCNEMAGQTEKFTRQESRIRELEAALAAARNRAIEECAQAVEQYMADSTPRARGAAIRALATGETKPSEDRT